MRYFLRNLELILTVAGLLVVFVVTAVAEKFGAERWFTAAIAASAVGVVHGLLFWVVRTRQRKIRDDAIRDIQAMLSDIINNQLTVIETARTMSNPNDKATEHISRSVNVISGCLKTLSQDSLRKWQAHYHRAVQI